MVLNALLDLHLQSSFHFGCLWENLILSFSCCFSVWNQDPCSTNFFGCQLTTVLNAEKMFLSFFHISAKRLILHRNRLGSHLVFGCTFSNRWGASAVVFLCRQELLLRHLVFHLWYPRDFGVPCFGSWWLPSSEIPQDSARSLSLQLFIWRGCFLIYVLQSVASSKLCWHSSGSPFQLLDLR